MKPHCRDNIILKEDVLIRMLGILCSIVQNLEKFQNRKSLHIKHIYGFDEVVHDDACYEENEEYGDFVSLDNIIHVYNKFLTHRH